MLLGTATVIYKSRDTQTWRLLREKLLKHSHHWKEMVIM